MSRYRLAQVPGATSFFTANLRNRRSDLLVCHVDLLRETVRATKHRPPSIPMHGAFLPDTCIASGRCPTGTQISLCPGRSSSCNC